MYTNTRIPVEISFITFRDDNLPATSVAEYRRVNDRRGSKSQPEIGSGSAAENTFALTTGSFPQELILTTRSSFANVKKIELTLDEAKEIVVERCLFNGNSSNVSAAVAAPTNTNISTSVVGGADPMSAVYEVIGERRLARGEEINAPPATTTTTTAATTVKDSAGTRGNTVKPRKPQFETLELDPAGAGKGIRAIKLKIMSGYSDFVGLLGVAIYGEESEQRIAVMESKAEVNM